MCDFPARQAQIITSGAKVFLKACRVGQPGTVLRMERGKLTVYWADMDFWSKHRPEALEIATVSLARKDERQ